MKTNKLLTGVVLFLIVSVVVVAVILYVGNKKVSKEGVTIVPQVATSTEQIVVEKPIKETVTIAQDLFIPWDLAFLPDGGILVTERRGTLVEIMSDGKKTSIKLPRPVPKGEGGLLGVVLHPDFIQNKYVYFYMTTSENSKGTTNAVFRYVFENGALVSEKTIISNIPGALYHDGGRMEFGPDGYLYITTGDAQSPAIAQNLKSLGGKILRITDEGKIPDDNPYKTAVYSYGHRNPQGLAWDSEGRLWETEHGRSGVTSGMDELNLIIKGGNYGWPTIEGDVEKKNMLRAAVHSGAIVTWAPASLVYLQGKLYFGGLKGEALYEAILDGDKVKEIKKHLFQEYGRIRTVRIGPDEMLYITTSNRDGRGTAKAGDDKVVKIDPRSLK